MKTGLEDIVESIRQRPAMYFTPVSVDVAAACVQGHDAASGGRQLAGFQPWLVEHPGQGQNLAWSALARRLAFRRAQAAGREGPNLEARAVRQFLQLVLEYLDARDEAEPKDGRSLASGH